MQTKAIVQFPSQVGEGPLKKRSDRAVRAGYVSAAGPLAVSDGWRLFGLGLLFVDETNAHRRPRLVWRIFRLRQ